MPSDLVFKSANSMHRMLLKLTGGRIGWKVSKMPALELTTIGRTSGKPRSVMITAPWQEGDTMVVVASAGGNDEHPDWFLNLRANPAVTVRTEAGDKKVTARIAEGDERERLWEQITTKYDHYAGYQGKTERAIPIVLLDPAT